jgi:hypothetical protein
MLNGLQECDSMKNYAIRRVLQLIPVPAGHQHPHLCRMKMIPGDVISGILGVEATPELRAQLAAKYGLDRPYVIQYLDWIGGVLRGDFGESIRTSAPNLPEILTRFKVTAELTILAAVISWCIAIPLGVLAAVKRNTLADRFVRVFALLGVSVPGFALSILLILVLSLALTTSRRWLCELLRRPAAQPADHDPARRHSGCEHFRLGDAHDPLLRAGGPAAGFHQNRPCQGRQRTGRYLQACPA